MTEKLYDESAIDATLSQGFNPEAERPPFNNETNDGYVDEIGIRPASPTVAPVRTAQDTDAQDALENLSCLKK